MNPIKKPPFIFGFWSISKINSLILCLLSLPVATSLILFGPRTILLIITCTLSGLATEVFIKKFTKKPSVCDGGSLVICILLALTLPVTFPLWMACIGSVFSIGLVKEAFGGTGNYIFNPIVGGRVFMEVSFPLQFSELPNPVYSMETIVNFIGDNLFFANISSQDNNPFIQFIGFSSGGMGETSALVLIISGLPLFIFKIFDWRIPFAFLLTLGLLTFIFNQEFPYTILGGGVILAAIFIANDFTSTPITKKGRLIFGFSFAFLTFFIKYFGTTTGGVYFALLLSNSIVPLIDKYFIKRPE